MNCSISNISWVHLCNNGFILPLALIALCPHSTDSEMNSLVLLFCMLVLCLCLSLPSISAQKGNKSTNKATKVPKKSQQNTMKRVAEAKAEARRATEAKRKEILRPYVPKSKLPVESETKQEKKKREFQKSCLRTMPRTFSLDQRTQFCQGECSFTLPIPRLYIYLYIYHAHTLHLWCVLCHVALPMPCLLSSPPSSAVSTPEPIQCANDGRSGIKLSFDEIMELCGSSSSSFPVECYKMVSNKDRKLYGMQLCREAQNSLTWKCWRGVLSWSM